MTLGQTLNNTMPKIASKQSRKRKLPSEFDNCMKLDAIGGAIADMNQVLQCIAVGHPDALSRGFQTAHSAPFAFQSVFFDAKKAVWMPAYRYLAASYQRVHKGLFDPRVPPKWKCLYEIIVQNRPRNLYFDLEEQRPTGMCQQEHDKVCWAKVQLLVHIVRDSFRYGSHPLQAVSCSVFVG